MEVNYAVGIAYDVAFYMTACFYGGLMFEKFGAICDISGMYGTFIDFLKKHENFKLPEDIKPFVYTNYDIGTHSFLIRFVNEIDHFDSVRPHVLDEFNDVEYVKRKFLKHILSSTRIREYEIDKMLSESSDSDFFDVLRSLNFEEDVKFRLPFIVANFERYHKVLVDTLATVCGFVRELHRESHDVVSEIRALAEDEEQNCAGRIREHFCVPEHYETVSIYVTLLNDVMIHCKSDEGRICLGLGRRFMAKLDTFSLVKDVSFRSFSRLVNSDVRYSIIQLFMKYEKLCLAEVAHKMGLSKTSALTHINVLWENRVLVRVDLNDRTTIKNGLYFKLNPCRGDFR